MPYTKAPNQSTYVAKEFPIIKEMNSRAFSEAKDVDYLNVVIETTINPSTGQKEHRVSKRFGTEKINTFSFTADQFITGWYVWKTSSWTYLFVGLSNSTIQVVNLSGTAADFGDLVTTLSAATLGFSDGSGGIAFTEFLYDNGTVKLVAGDANSLCTIDTSLTVVQVTDPQFNFSIVPKLVYLDGYLFVIKNETGDVYNSDLNDPTSWTAGNFITAEQHPDKVRWIEKIQNYLVLVGDMGIEFFYNAGIASGSPLQRNISLAKQVGIASEYCWPVLYGDKLLMVGRKGGGQTGQGGIDIFAVGIDSIEAIGNSMLQQKLNNSRTTNSITLIDNVQISILAMPDNGLDLCLVSIPESTGFAFKNYAINLLNKTVTRFTFINANRMAPAITTTQRGNRSLCLFVNPHFAAAANVYALSSETSQDDGTNYTFTFITDLEDFGTINRKTLHRLSLIGDKPASTASVSVSWTDDDYQNYNTPITVDMYQELPSITRLGHFRRRAFKISGTHALDFSLSRIEVDLNIGQS